MTEPTHKSAWTLGMPGCLGAILSAIIGGVFTLLAVSLQQKPCDNTNLNSNIAILVNKSNVNSHVNSAPNPTISNSPPILTPTPPSPTPETPRFTPVVVENFRFTNFECHRADEITCTFGIENLATDTRNLQIFLDSPSSVSNQGGMSMSFKSVNFGGAIGSYSQKDIPNNLKEPMLVELKLSSNSNSTGISEMKIKFLIVTAPQKYFVFTLRDILIK